MKNLKSKVKKAILDFSLFPSHSRVLVALSGGPDSITLLHVLLSLKDEFSLTVGAVHVNHMLRGDESERDELFVREICQKWDVPLFVERVDIPEISRGKNVEAVARRERYRLFRETLKKWGGDVVALGHTASDLVETVLLNLTKGAGIKGLRGFLPKRDVFVRPLFLVTRMEVELYVKEKQLPYVVDSSNLSTDYDRNLLRIRVIPVLREINPSLEKTILRETFLLRELEDYLDSQVVPVVNSYMKGDSFCIPLSEAKKLHPFLLGEVIRRAYRKISQKDLPYRSVEEIKRAVNREGFKKFQFHSGILVYKDQKLLCIEPEENAGKSFFYEVKELPAVVETPLYTLKFSVNSGVPILPLSLFGENGIIVRSRKPGDRLSFGKFSKSLKKFLIERKFPARQRSSLPIVESGGEIIFIPGLYVKEVRDYGNFVGVEFEEKAQSSSGREKDQEKS